MTEAHNQQKEAYMQTKQEPNGVSDCDVRSERRAGKYSCSGNKLMDHCKRCFFFLCKVSKVDRICSSFCFLKNIRCYKKTFEGLWLESLEQ